MNEYEDFLISWICDKNGLNSDKIILEANMFEQGYLDSLGVFGLLLDIEIHFDIVLDENDILNQQSSTIAGLATILAKKSSKA